MDIRITSQQMEGSDFNDRGFRQVVEDHLQLLINGAERANIAPALAAKYHGNFYGLLKHYPDIVKETYWVILRCNGYHNPMDYNQKTTVILIPDYEVISALLNTYLTRKKHN